MVYRNTNKMKHEVLATHQDQHQVHHASRLQQADVLVPSSVFSLHMWHRRITLPPCLCFSPSCFRATQLCCPCSVCKLGAGGSHGFLACAALYALGNACIGASPVAYAADVTPANLGGFGLGMYRCAGDLGTPSNTCSCWLCVWPCSAFEMTYSPCLIMPHHASPDLTMSCPTHDAPPK